MTLEPCFRSILLCWSSVETGFSERCLRPIHYCPVGLAGDVAFSEANGFLLGTWPLEVLLTSVCNETTAPRADRPEVPRHPNN